jgi:hypothetical protein
MSEDEKVVDEGNKIVKKVYVQSDPYEFENSEDKNNGDENDGEKNYTFLRCLTKGLDMYYNNLPAKPKIKKVAKSPAKKPQKSKSGDVNPNTEAPKFNLLAKSVIPVTINLDNDLKIKEPTKISSAKSNDTRIHVLTVNLETAENTKIKDDADKKVVKKRKIVETVPKTVKVALVKSKK